MRLSTASSKLALAVAIILHSTKAAVLHTATAGDNPPGEEHHCEGYTGPETDVNICRTQTGPQCTFSLSCVTAAESDETSGGIAIYNNACTCINNYEEYNFATTGDTSVFPFDIQTAGLNPGLYYNVTVLYTDCAANPLMKWSYNGATYDESICDCEDDSSGLEYDKACRCTFPC